ncbi:hypothetical protein ACQ4M3_30455 [Leptolyngbya sp. AN03gr2]|uniref:hypothetical protein n=1 Tax=unclassified Leptolyngbya TaxID=2650499 RepID=UPI003D31D7F6
MIPAHPENDAVPNSAAENYRIRLHPWCIIRLLPKMQRIVLARFRTRTQAEEYLRIVKNLMPTAAHQIVFDPETE